METPDSIPNPGSEAAIGMGCTCAVMDNNHGRGFPYQDGKMSFWISDDCPIHGTQLDERELSLLDKYPIGNKPEMLYRPL